METRPYFVLGDVLANSVVGALVGVASAALFGPGWNMIIAMLVGMALGMVISLPALLGFVVFFGAMEVMVPAMITGMVAGMVVSMSATMGPLSFASAAVLGVKSGLGVLVAIYLANIIVKRRAALWTT
ncbi:MAG: hypothetical protein AAEJ53_13010 [Myxococcota bacterium]